MVVSCEICGKQFDSFRGLNGHRNAHIKRAESFTPPSSAVKAAKKGLSQRKEWGRGGLSPSEAKAQGIDSGVTRARKIASGSVSRHDVRRMSAFNRHRKNNRPDKKMPDGGPTAGTIAWNLWGGTSGVNWAKKKSAAMNAETFNAESDAETLDYNSFTNDMEALLAKYSQLLLTYETEYQSKERGGDGIMEVFMRFKPYNAYFDDVDFDAESFGPVDEEGQLAKALAAVREKSKRYAPTPLRLTKLPHPDQKSLKDFEADWRDLSRDNSGRWLPAGDSRLPDDSTVSFDMADMSWMTPSEYYEYILEEPLDISDDIEDDTQTIEFQERLVRYTAMTMLPQEVESLIKENAAEITEDLFADNEEADSEINFLNAVKRYQKLSEQWSAEE